MHLRFKAALHLHFAFVFAFWNRKITLESGIQEINAAFRAFSYAFAFAFAFAFVFASEIEKSRFDKSRFKAAFKR